MTRNRTFKKAVRERMAQTGEKYMAARDAIAGPAGSQMPAAAQLERYVAAGYPSVCGLSDEGFRERMAPLVSDDGRDGYDEDTGRVAALLVVRQRLVPAAEAMNRVEVGGKHGYVDMTPADPGDFNEIDRVDTPDGEAYVVHDFDPGDEYRNLPPSEAMKRIEAAGRSPVTIDEGLAAVVLFPRLVADRHAFSILASRSSTARVRESVPAIWISKGAPRLGWCWDNNPHTWLGSASCGGRTALPVQQAG